MTQSPNAPFPAKPTPSHQYRITMSEGALDVLRACLARIEATTAAEHAATTYQELAHTRQLVIQQMWSVLRALGYGLLHSTPFDGDVTLHPDGTESLFFRFDSGYHGAMIFHESARGPEHGHWSIHT